MRWIHPIKDVLYGVYPELWLTHQLCDKVISLLTGPLYPAMASSCNTNTNNNTEKMSIQERVLSPPRPKPHPQNPGSQVTSSNMSSQSFRPPTASAEAPVQSNLSDADKLFNYVSSLSLPASPTPSPPKRGRGRGRPRGRPRGRGRGRGRGRTSGEALKRQQPMEVEGSKAMMMEQPTPEFSVVTGEWANVAIGQTLPVMPHAGTSPAVKGLEEVKVSASFSQQSEVAQSIKQSILNNPVAAIITEGSPRVVTASVIAMVTPEERNIEDNKAAWNPEADQPSEDLESTLTPKKRKSSGEKSTSRKSKTPKSALSETSPGDSTSPKKKKKKYDRHLEIERFPGTKLKICNNCGTVSEKIKAKKCHNCKKFFFDHWARRCKIPPCPTCHYSRKSRQCERVPEHCERCGNPLPMLPVETLNEATSDDDESVCTSVVSNNSCEVAEEPATPSEDVARQGRKRRRSSKNLSNEYDAGETQDETSSMHQSSYPEFDSETSTTQTYHSDSNPRALDSPQTSSPEVGPPLSKQKAAAVTRSGRVYKQNRGKGNEGAEEVAVMGEGEGGSEVLMVGSSCEVEGSKTALSKSYAIDSTPSVLQDTIPTGLQDTTHPGGLQDTTHPGGLQDTTHPGGLQDTTHPGGLQDTTHPGGLQDTTHPGGLQDITHPGGLQDITHPGGLQDTTHPGGLQDTTHPGGLQDTTHPGGLQDITHPGGLKDNLPSDLQDTTHPGQKDMEPPAFASSAPADSSVPNLIHATTQSVITTTNDNISSKSPSSMFFSNIRFGNDNGNTIPSADKLSSPATPPINVTNSLSQNPVVQSADSSQQGLPVTSVGVVKPLDKVQVDAKVESSVSKPSVPDSKPNIPWYLSSVPVSKPIVPNSGHSVPESKPTVPESKPTVPESKPIVPESKPTVPESKPTVPESKPIVPESKPTVPESKPTVPESKPIVPESKLIVPESKPSAPESKPSAAESKPIVPESKPTVPESKPSAAESKPIVPESKPLVPESKQTVPESKPTVPESKPTVPESKPIVPEPKPTVPESKPTVPESKPTVPESKPIVPEPKPTVPKSKPSAPESKPTVPESKPTVPESKPTVPKSKPTVPESTVSGESDGGNSSKTTGSPFLSARFRSLYAHIEATANSEVELRRNSKIPLNKRGQGITPPPLAKRIKFSSETSAFHEVSTSTTAAAAAVPGIPLIQYAQRLSVDMKPLPIPLASITTALTAPALNSLTAAFSRKYFPKGKLPDISKLLPPSIPLLTATSSPPLLPSGISQAASGESVATQTASSLKANAPSSVNTTKQAAFQPVSPQSLATTPAQILFSPANLPLLQNYSPLLQSFLLNPPPLQSLPMVTPLLPSSKASITTTAASISQGGILTPNLPTSVAQKSDNKISSSVKKLPITSQQAVPIKQSTGSVSHATISVGKDATTAAISRSPTTYTAAISSIFTAAISSNPTTCTSTAAISRSPTTSTAAISSIFTAAISSNPTTCTSTAATSRSPTTSTAAISSISTAAISNSPTTSAAPVSTSSSTTQTSSSYKGQSFQPLVRATPAVLGANNIKVSVIATQISSSPTPILTTTTHNKTSPPALVNISPSSSVLISGTKTGLSSSTNTSKVVYTQTIQTPRVCPAPQSSTVARDITTPRHVEKAIGTQDAPVSTGAELDTNLQILTSTVQSRIQKALSTPKAVPIVPHPAQTTTAPASNPSSGSKPGQLLVEAASNTGIAAITSSHQLGYSVPNPTARVQVRLHPETATVFIQPETRVKTQGVHFPIPVATSTPSEVTTVRHKSQASNTVRIKPSQGLGTKKEKPPVTHSSDRKPAEIASEKVYATTQLSPSYTTQPQQSQQQQGVNKAPGGGRVVKATIFMPWKPGSSTNQNTKTQEKQVSSTSVDTMGTSIVHQLRRSSDVSQGVEMELAESGSQMTLSQRSEEVESQLSQTESESEGEEGGEMEGGRGKLCQRE